MSTQSAALGRGDIVLFTVSAILLLETLTAAASIGPAAIFWWLLLGVIFFIPIGLISAEMGCSYPDEGGIYAWVRNAFGRRWGARASWAYWVNTAVWLPAIHILFAGIFSQLFAPDLSLSSQIAIAITLSWLTVGMNVVDLRVGKWVPNFGAVIKVIVFIVIIVGAVVFAQNQQSANPITWVSIRPDWGSSLSYIPAIVYGMLGFELVSANSQEMKNPARDVPRGLLVSALIIITLYTAATAAVLAAIPAGEVDLVEGLLQTLYLFFGTSGAGGYLVVLLGLGALFTFFSNGVTWSIGCNQAAAQAARDHELPAYFSATTAAGTPIGAAIVMGCLSTLVLLLYGVLAENNADLFWSLFTFSAVIFLLPYLGMLLAFVQARVIDPDHPRPFRVPGGIIIARLLAGICFAVLSLSILLFIYTPGEGIQWPVLLGALSMIAVGEVLVRRSDARS